MLLKNYKIYILIIQSILLTLFPGCSRKQEYNMDLINKFEARIYTNKKFRLPLLYRLYIPENYNELQKYPIILYLHDGGPRGDDNKSQISSIVEWLINPPVQSTQNCFIMIPQCPKKSQWLNTKFKKTPFLNYNQDEIPESDTMKMIILEINNLMDEFNIDENRIYVTGYSMGGSGTWDIITRYPDFFAAAVPVTGVSDPSKAKLVAHMPIWAFHGQMDTISLVENTRNMVTALKKYGSNCKFTELKDVSHDSWHAAYNNTEVITWLFDQKKNRNIKQGTSHHSK